MSNPAAALTARVDAALSSFLAGRTHSLLTVGPELQPIADLSRQFVLGGGKRLRPRFAYWGWRATQNAQADDTALITAAASLELLHACALVHDDVMDASDTRRGRPSTHQSFAALHRASGWPGDADSFGASSAILLGDLLLCWADAMFASAAMVTGTRRVYDEMRELVMAGQYLDVQVQARGEFSVDDALRVAKFKTSKYTIEGPLHLGAAAAGAPADVFAGLSAYGLPLGEAFQLRDDVLGVFGNPTETGKPAGDDLREGKRTLLVALAMQHASAADAELLGRRLGQRSLDDAGVEALRHVIIASGALAQVETRIAASTAEARAALADAAISAPARTALDELAVAATVRRS